MDIEIARLPVSLVGDHPILQYVKDEFSLFPKTKRSPKLVFHFTNTDICVPNLFVKVGNLYVANDSVIIKDLIDYKIVGNFFSDDITYIELSFPKIKYNYFLESLRKTFRRLKNWNYLDLVQFLVKEFVYNIFDYCLHLKLLHFNSALIHASAVEKDGNGFLFLANGGVGKTTIMTYLVFNFGFKFLSDDISIIDNNTIYLNPKYLQIYPYNLTYNPELRKQLFDKMGVLDKLHWYYRFWKYGAKGVRRRISPSDLFGMDSLAESGSISRIFFLQPIIDHTLEIKQVSPEILANKCAYITMNEIYPFTYYANLIHSALGANKILFPDFANVLRKTEEVYKNCFLNKKCYLISFDPNVSLYKILNSILEFL